MRDIDRAHRTVREQADEVLHQQLAGLRIQRRQRFIHQEDRRLHRQRPRDADALTHSAGQLLGIGRTKFGEAGPAQCIIDHRAALADRQPSMQQREFDIRLHRAPGQQRKILKHECQRIEAIGRRRAAQQSGARAWLQQAAEDRQQRALAAAGRTDDRYHLARAERERDIVEHVERAKAVADMVGDKIHHIPRVS